MTVSDWLAHALATSSQAHLLPASGRFASLWRTQPYAYTFLAGFVAGINTQRPRVKPEGKASPAMEA